MIRRLAIPLLSLTLIAAYSSCGKKSSGGGGGEETSGGGDGGGGETNNPVTTTTTHNLLMMSISNKLHSYNIKSGAFTKISDKALANAGLKTQTSNQGSRLSIGAGGKFFFEADWDDKGQELWKYDPSQDITASNPSLVRELANGTAGGEPKEFNAIGTTVYFNAKDSIHKKEIHVLDTTKVAAGDNPKLLKDLGTAVNGSNPKDLYVLGKKLFFTADTENDKRKLWVYDTEETVSATNPKSISNIRNGSGDGIGEMIGIGTKLFFKGSTDGTAFDMYTYDTAAATPAVTKVNIDTNSTGDDDVKELATDGKDYIVFSATLTSKGSELFVYKPGESIGASNPKGYDLNDGTTGSSIQGFVHLKDAMFGVVATVAGDTNLWILDASKTMDGTNPKKVDISSGNHTLNVNGGHYHDGKLYVIGKSNDTTVGDFFLSYDTAKETDAITFIKKKEAAFIDFSNLAPLTYTTTTKK